MSANTRDTGPVMGHATQFERKTLQGELFELPERLSLPHLCEYARPFCEWCETLLEETVSKGGEIAVNLALLQLQSQYWSRYASAPVRHRDHIGSRGRHTCLFQVYAHFFGQLRELRLQVNPPQLREARPPYVPPPPQIAGVPFGILEDDAEDG